MLVGVVAGLAGAVLFGCGAVLQAHAVRRLDAAPDRLAGFVASSVRDPRTMLVVAMYLAGFVLHAVAIWLLPLYLAQVTVAMSLPVTAVVSMWTLHEHLPLGDWAALVAVTLGLVLVAMGSGTPGEVLVSPEFAGLLGAGLVVFVTVSLARNRLAGGALGALSGLGYSASAIAVRGVDADVSLLVAVAALAVPSYSLVAFWLYSLGMDRAEVSAVTAPLIVLQTFVPALVGVWLLGDTVRDGWWPGGGRGLVGGPGGALVLPRATRTASASGPASVPGPGSRPGPTPRRSA